MNSIIFVAFMFAPALPILYLVGFVWCFITYLTQKYMILYFYKRELSLKNELAEMSVHCLMWAILAHIVIAYLCLLNSSIRQTFARHEDISHEEDNLLTRHFEYDKPWFRYVDYRKENDLSLDDDIRIELSNSLNSLDSIVYFLVLVLEIVIVLILMGIYCCTQSTVPKWSIEKRKRFD